MTLPSFSQVMVGDGFPWATHARERWLPTRASKTGGGAFEKVGEAVTKNREKNKKKGCHNLSLNALKSSLFPVHLKTVIESHMRLHIKQESDSQSTSQWSHTQYWHFKNWKTKLNRQDSQKGTADSFFCLLLFHHWREAGGVWVSAAESLQMGWLLFWATVAQQQQRKPTNNQKNRIPTTKSHTESRCKLNFVHRMKVSLLR